jgi:ABC-type sugar transport system ATPase subunit
MASVKLVDLKKTYDNGHEAVKGISFEAGETDFTVFVGPSGCGKTTTLRMII